MKNFFLGLLLVIGVCSCEQNKAVSHNFKNVTIKDVFTDTCQIRTLEVMKNGTIAFAGKNGLFGTYDATNHVLRKGIQRYEASLPEFRATAHTSEDFFMLSVANPALLYKTAGGGQMELVYQEVHEKVFYDAMKFWNDQEGIAVGDATDTCASIIITRDGGESWQKLPCDQLPAIQENEAFFAASNTNIVVMGNETWIASGGSRSAILYSPDKGKHWELFETPFVQGEASGIFSIDFYDAKNGFAVGGNYMQPTLDVNNKAVTTDGGKTWNIVADNAGVGYKSCVQYVPNGNAKEIVAVGKNGIVYSTDAGQTWKQLSEEGFYTFRFVDEHTAFAAGKNRISKLVFK